MLRICQCLDALAALLIRIPPPPTVQRFPKPNRELGSDELLYSLWCTTSDTMTEQKISDRGKTNVYIYICELLCGQYQ